MKIGDLHSTARASVHKQIGQPEMAGHCAHPANGWEIVVGEFAPYTSGGAANGAGEWRGKKARARVSSPTGELIDVTLYK